MSVVERRGMKDLMDRRAAWIRSMCVAATGFVLAFGVVPSAKGATFEYDSLNRLVSVDYGNGNSIEYTYDQAGNRLTETVIGTGAPGPVARFAASPLSGTAPLVVQFSDQSLASPTTWLWDFGDGTTSSVSSPMHTYSVRGTYTVSLTVSNDVGFDTETKQDLISVVSPVENTDTIALYLDVGAGAVRYAQVPFGTVFDVIVITDTQESSAAGEFVLTDVANLMPSVFRLSVTKINNSNLDLGDNNVGEYFLGYSGCVPPGPAEIVRIRYGVFVEEVPSDFLLTVRGFQSGNSQPSSFGGEPGYVDCNEGLHTLSGLEPRLRTGSGAVVSLGGAVINPTLPVVPYVATAAPSALRSTLGQSTPNPFNPRTRIAYSLDAPKHAELVVYDLAGRRVKTLVSGHVDAGPHEAEWDGTDDHKRRVASGVYLYRLVAGEFSETKRMVLLK